MTTRAEWYAQRKGGGWRMARKDRRCDCRPYTSGGVRCMNMIRAGERYFDTNAQNPYSPNVRATIGLCEHCAKGEIA